MSRPERNGKSAGSPADDEGSRSPALVPPSSLADFDLGGSFRRTFLVWFDDPGERQAVEQLERAIDLSLGALEEPPAAFRRRARAIAAELLGLRDVLADIANEREGSSLSIPDWELARLAASAATAADSWAESVFNAVSDEDTPVAAAHPGDRPAVRETALWAATGSVLAEELREIGRMLFLYARELAHRCGSPRAVAEPPAKVEASAIRRDVRATAADLLHLASFAAATVDEMPFGDPLRGLLEGLVYGLARWVERLCQGLEKLEPEPVD